MPSPLSLDALRERAAAGETFAYLHFWGHRPHPDGRVGPSCLSQWYAAPFVIDGLRYPTAEHWMMAGKARLFEDEAAHARVLAVDNPARAKAVGRDVRGFDEARWRAHRFEIVVRGNLAKFGQNPPLRDFLLGTGGKVLVEASPVDAVWGIGCAAADAESGDPTRWRGLNLLGFALMAVRERLSIAADG